MNKKLKTTFEISKAFNDIRQYLEKKLKITLPMPISIRQHFNDKMTIEIGFSNDPEHLRYFLSEKQPEKYPMETAIIYVSEETGAIWFNKRVMQTFKENKYHYEYCYEDEFKNALGIK